MVVACDEPSVNVGKSDSLDDKLAHLDECLETWTVVGLAPTEGEAASETSCANTQCCRDRKPVLRSAIWLLIIALMTAVMSYFQEDWNVCEWELATVAYMFQKWIGRAVLGHELGGVSPQSASGRLRQLREAYLVLMHAAETLQQHFGLPLALIIAGCVGGTTFYAYDVVSSGRKRHSPFEWSIMSGLWMVHHSLQLVALSLACAATVDSAAYTGPLLLRASALCDWRGPELDAFTQVTLRGPRLQFSAAGLVVIDRRLLVSALAVVVTYLVILGQQ
ncbi:uncharacterized protein LOC126152474 [Schistocerca cancellata]|uniref:uncharacterized protein LOC126152474 n=1 Tax=Schistocerca cancellata TaxID=274614 RepID=UPI0021174870|nr:uncharacterized protein LOC126152474 [Schistocerca cancellata]